MVTKFVVILLVISYSATSCFSLNIEVDPPTYTEKSQGPVNITCIPDASAIGTGDIYLMEIKRNDEKPLVFLRATSGIEYGTDTFKPSQMQVDGTIDTDVSKSYLRLSINNPSNDDQGIYFCIMFYSTDSGFLKERRTSHNLTIDKMDVHKTMRNLLAKVALLENEIEDQALKANETRTQMANRIETLEYAKDNLERINRKLLEKIESLEDPSTLPFRKITLATGEKFLYYIPGLSMNYYGARDYCYSVGAYLLNFDSVEEYDAVKSFVANQKTQNAVQYFVGANDIEHEGVWVTEKDGKPWDATVWLWMGGQPSNSGNNEDCATFRSNRLNDAPCQGAIPFICERTPK